MSLIYPPLLVIVALTAVATALCDRIKYLKSQVTVGIIFGAISFAANFLNCRLEDLDIFIGVRDAAPQSAAILFGPYAGIISAVIGASGRIINGLFVTGHGASSMYHYASASIVVVLFACVMRKWVFDNKRPGAFVTALVLGHGEVILYRYLILIATDDIVIDELLATFLPECANKMLCGFLVALMCRERKLLPERKLMTNSALFVVYLSVLLVIRQVAFNAVTDKCSERLETELTVLSDEPGNKISSTLIRIANELVKDGCNLNTSSDTLKQYAEKYSLGEVSIIGQDKKVIASSLMEQYIATNNFGKLFKYRLEQFTHGKYLGGAEVYFNKAWTPDNVDRLYAVCPMKDNQHFILLGMDLAYYMDNLHDLGLPDILDWNVGEAGFYIITDKKTDNIVSIYKEHLDFLNQPFDECVHVAGGERRKDGVKIVSLVGVSYFCNYFDMGNYRFYVLLSRTEIYTPAVGIIASVGTIAALVCILLGFVLRQRSKTNEMLEEQRKQEEKRQAQDLETAKTIQTSALPMVFPPSSWDMTIDLYASMQPANEVGGDFYDFYYLGDNRIVFLVADVSGKGIPAAMFMMKAKSIIKASVGNCTDLGEAMTEVNSALCQNNTAEMFVTCWIGILNTGDGSVEYVNAGHNAPYIRHADGSIQKIETISGFFLAGLEETEYVTSNLKLNRGDTIFLFTDGVTEANNIEKKMFDDAGLEKVLTDSKMTTSDLNAKGMPRLLCKSVKDAVTAFAAGAPQFDDMTMLALHYRGMPYNRFCTIQANTESMPTLTQFVEEQLELCKCDDETKTNILIVLDEISANVISYSGSPDFSVKFTRAENPATIMLTFSDSGVPYNPLNAPPPDLTLPAEERPIGGLGIFIIKKMMDDISYSRKNGWNTLTLIKHYTPMQ